MHGVGVLLVVAVEAFAAVEYAYTKQWSFSAAWGCYAIASFALWLAGRGVGV